MHWLLPQSLRNGVLYQAADNLICIDTDYDERQGGQHHGHQHRHGCLGNSYRSMMVAVMVTVIALFNAMTRGTSLAASPNR